MYVLVYANGFDQVCIDVRKKKFQFNCCNFLMVVKHNYRWLKTHRTVGTHHSSESQHQTMEVFRELL